MLAAEMLHPNVRSHIISGETRLAENDGHRHGATRPMALSFEGSRLSSQSPGKPGGGKEERIPSQLARPASPVDTENYAYKIG